MNYTRKYIPFLAFNSWVKLLINASNSWELLDLMKMMQNLVC